MSVTYVKTGCVRPLYKALHVDLDNFTLGKIVVGAQNVVNLLKGETVGVDLVKDDGDEPFIANIGDASVSTTGKSIRIRVENQFFYAPIAQVEATVAGKRKGAYLSARVVN